MVGDGDTRIAETAVFFLSDIVGNGAPGHPTGDTNSQDPGTQRGYRGPGLHVQALGNVIGGNRASRPDGSLVEGKVVLRAGADGVPAGRCWLRRTTPGRQAATIPVPVPVTVVTALFFGGRPGGLRPSGNGT